MSGQRIKPDRVKLDIDVDYIAAVLRILFAPGEVIELRIPNVPRAGTVSGYFDDFLMAARAAAGYNLRADGVYVTLNPVHRALLARSANHLAEWARSVTSDADVPLRRRLLLDFDPLRPAGISSSEAELAAALERRDAVQTWLSQAGGFPAGLAAMSGNGGHLLYWLPDLPNDVETTDLVRACIVAVKSRFGDELVSVDDTVFNASRLTKLYGTWARKGDHMPDRPHRRSYLELPSTPPQPVLLDCLRWLAGQAGPKPGSRGAAPARAAGRADSLPVFFTTPGRRLDVAAYLAAARVNYRVRCKGGVTWYNLKDCPVHTDPDGDHYECGICQFGNGTLGARCQHDPTAGWPDFKAALGDPAPYYTSNETVSSFASFFGAKVDTPQAAAGQAGLTLDQVVAYARCPMAHVLQYRAGAPALPTGSDLVELSLRQALHDFHAGNQPSPFAALQAAWRALLETWGVKRVDAAYTALEGYAHLRTELLLPFMRGEITRHDGSRYAAPRKSQVYRNAARARGLLQRQAAVDERIPHPPISLRGDDCLGDVFADALEMALLYHGPAVGDLAGVQVPFRLDLPPASAGQAVRLSGLADLLARVHERGQAGLAAVLYDFEQPTTWEVLRHDVRVLALLNAGEAFWQGCDLRTVRVMYLRAGQAVNVYGSSNPAWGRALLSAAAQAMDAPGIPRMAVSPGHCRDCRYWELCASPDGWNVLMGNLQAPTISPESPRGRDVSR